MAYFIILNPAWANETGIKEHNHHWNIEEEKPDFPIDFYRNGIQVDLLQADGEELFKINADFQGIPTKQHGTVVWRGELASFIFNNL